MHQLRTAEVKGLLRYLGAIKSEWITLDLTAGVAVTTDANLTVRVNHESLKVDGPRFVIPYTKFAAFVNKSKDLISVQKMDGCYRFLSGRLSADIPEGATPGNILLPLEYTAQLPADVIKNMVSFVSSVTDTKDTLSFKGVIRIESEEDMFGDTTLRTVATDGFRCAKCEVEIDSAPFPALSIPSGLANLIGLFNAGIIQIADTPNILGLRFEHVEAISTKLNIEFPDIASVFTPSYPVWASFSRNDLHNSLSALSPFLEDEDITVKFDQQMEISVKGARDSIEYVGEKVMGTTFRTNFKFLSDYTPTSSGTIIMKTDPKTNRIVFESDKKQYLFCTKL